MPRSVETTTHPSTPGRPGQPPGPEQIARILHLAEQNVGIWQIARDVFGYGTAFYRRKVEQVLSKESNETNTDR